MGQLRQERIPLCYRFLFLLQVLQKLLRHFREQRRARPVRPEIVPYQAVPFAIVQHLPQHRKTARQKAFHVAIQQTPVDFHAPLLNILRRRDIIRVTQVLSEAVLYILKSVHVRPRPALIAGGGSVLLLSARLPVVEC